MKWRAIWQTPKNAVYGLFMDNGFTLAAALAFYAILSVAPLLILLITVFGLVGESTQQQIIQQTEKLIGPQASQGVELILKNAKAQRIGATSSAAIGTGCSHPLGDECVRAVAVFAQYRLQCALEARDSGRLALQAVPVAADGRCHGDRALCHGGRQLDHRRSLSEQRPCRGDHRPDPFRGRLHHHLRDHVPGPAGREDQLEGHLGGRLHLRRSLRRRRVRDQQVPALQRR